MTLLLVPLVLAGCGSTAPKHKHAEPLSVAEHEQHAQAHEAEASLSHERVAPYESGGNEAECIDIGGPINTGGERTKVMKPCWTRAEQNASYLRSEAAHRSAAKDHREWAQQLLDVERVSCAGLGEIERATSPFVRGPDILSVEPYMEAQEIRGARVTFRRVRGLSKEWLLRSIRCHRARAATLGFDKAFMPFCPLALEHTASTVVEDAATVVVTLRARDAVVGAQIYGRALRAADDKGTADEAGPVKGTTN
jgi:hypothetical protein